MSRPLLLGAALLPALAFADLLPPNTQPCQGKAAGVACTTDDGQAGACRPATCSRNDYSEGPPPKTVTYECLQCSAAGPASDAGAAQAPEAPRRDGSCAAAPGTGLAVLALALLRARRRLR